MNYLVLKQRFYLVISVLTLIVLGSGYGSCTKFSDRLSDSAMVALDSFHHCQYMALSRGLGAAGRRSEQLDYADQLSRHTTVEQLAEIANTDTSRIARLWAYRILLKKADNQVIDVLKQALKDTTHVALESGCSGFEEPYYRAALSIYRYDSYELKLSNQLRFSLDSLIFFDYMKHYGFEDGLPIDFKPHKIYYATVIEEADKGNDAILPLLAQYKNPNDRQRINKLLKDNLKKAGVCSDEACEAISNWNDPAFEWYAKAACQATIKQEYYDAWDILQLLCAYPAPWSYQILKKLLTQKGDYSYSDTAKDYLTERYKTRPVPPIFKPLYDRYVARKK
ncbi:hypothetical protein LK413_10465 [Prevotella melaninogenica]|uniref:hypothetical protein n=1 Tax=Prevotella melaninogenica TaxID=28132 RepID=UPI001D137066|nr:hypothetical protein [Prevotella melaninogenica]UEB00168.1 hypothetical protein LK413_10465 [Prevotella melaninogenica]